MKLRNKRILIEKRLLTVAFLFFTLHILAQSNTQLPYYQIPEPAEQYTAGSVASRLVDGLGFRFYWASEGLRPEDLNYKASETGRTSLETIEHILSLSVFLLKNITSDELVDISKLKTYDAMRNQALLNIKMASDILRASEDLSVYDNNRFPFWNLINGPIADAMWHCGQLVTLRRASGNPFSSKVSVFQGKVSE
ncbi:hypothetical protein [Neotamlana laminarinivorans]|uniref:DinB family protein n=1 Tax=Neotamlana laminarinivorans TaxID=2883124 RepID=A0A9X1I2T2_9FLAO|nr:hypothetical protein [Tamlana laminarinivorans]MCB4798939.1 hypothetical protein [Tamlana laminarinivorans]